MSDDKQAKVKRAAPPPQMSAEPAAPIQAEPETEAALPRPTPRPALPVAVPATPSSAERCFAAYSAALASIGESQAAVASGLTAMALEVGGLTRSNLVAAGDGVTALLTARSLVDAVEAQLGVARRGLDAFADGSTRIGGIGLRLASDATKPIFRPFAVV